MQSTPKKHYNALFMENRAIGTKFKATSERGLSISKSAITEISPAAKDSMAPIAKAAPAQPCFAI